MLNRCLAPLLGLLLGVAGWSVAQEDKPERPPDPRRELTKKIQEARAKLIKANPELAEGQKAISKKRKDMMDELKKEETEFYAKLRTMSPELDDLEKQLEAIEAERKKKTDEAAAERKKKMDERKKAGGEKRGKKKKEK